MHAAFDPDYLLLLGGPDVVPHQQLRNPMLDRDTGPVDRLPNG